MGVFLAMMVLIIGTSLVVKSTNVDTIRARKLRLINRWAGIIFVALTGFYFGRTVYLMEVGPEPRAGQEVQVLEVWQSPANGERVMRIAWQEGANWFERDIRPDSESVGSPFETGQGPRYTVDERLMRGEDGLYARITPPSLTSATAQR